MRMTLLVLTLVAAGAVSASAQNPVGSPTELWTKVKTGDTVYVIDGSGQETTGVFARVSDSTLSLLMGGQLHDMPMKDVRVVSRQGDSVLNGFLIGAGIGAGLYSAFVASDDVGFFSGPEKAGAVVGGALVWGGIGALIDHFIKGRTVVFMTAKTTAVRLQPGLSRDRHGASLSLMFSR